MYVPPAFRESDLDRLHDFIEANSFGLLLTHDAEGLFGSHLPFVLDRTVGECGCLLAHVARANRQWQSLAGDECMCVFTGPHAYISPTWYQAEGTVPTWNYTAVHASGRAELIVDDEELLDLLERLTSNNERGRDPAWTFDRDAPHLRRLLPAIVGFRIPITRLAGKWKLGQNHPPGCRERVAAALAAEPLDDARAIAALMRDTLPTR